jgi:aldose 1-epimerase
MKGFWRKARRRFRRFTLPSTIMQADARNPGTQLSSRPYGNLPDGRPVEAWTLKGAGGMISEILTYGGAVSRLEVPDRDGVLADVVLGFDNLEQWRTTNQSYFGIIAGRIAGRVPGGRLSVDGEVFPLECNEGTNHLHGGTRGLGHRVWTAEPLAADDGAVALRLRYLSPAGEEGYPGEVGLAATYTVTAANELVFETEARADRVTPISLAQHSYFNLAGEGSGSIGDHEVQILAEEQMTTDEKMTPLGKAEPVTGAADLRRSRHLGDIIPNLWKQHGDLYHLSTQPGMKLAAQVLHRESGRLLEVHTTHDFLQFYTAAHLDGSIRGKSGRPYVRHGGLCLECQGYPDSGAGFGDIMVRPGKPQRHRTVYAFSTSSRDHTFNELQ